MLGNSVLFNKFQNQTRFAAAAEPKTAKLEVPDELREQYQGMLLKSVPKAIEIIGKAARYQGYTYAECVPNVEAAKYVLDKVFHQSHDTLHLMYIL